MNYPDYPPELQAAICNHVWAYTRDGTWCMMRCGLWRPVRDAVDYDEEETGELSHAVLKQIQNIRTNENHSENARDAVGDIVIYLMDFCNSQEWDIHEIIDEVWAVVSQREWRK